MTPIPDSSKAENPSDPQELATRKASDFKACVILGAGASLSEPEWYTEKDGRRCPFYPLERGFFSHPFSVDALEKYPRIKKAKDVFFPGRATLGMEEFFMFVDHSIQWCELKDRLGQKFDEQKSIQFADLPYLPFAPSLEVDNQLRHSGQLLHYSAQSLRDNQRYFAQAFFDPDDLKEPVPTFSIWKKGLIDLKTDLLLFLSDVFRTGTNEACQKTHGQKCSSQEDCQPSSKTLKQFYEKLSTPISDIATISFNYDLVADATLFELNQDFNSIREKENKSKAQWTSDIVYMQNFDLISDRRVLADYPLPPMLLKPHGSLNWLNYPDLTQGSFAHCYARNERPAYPTAKFLQSNGFVPKIFAPVQNKIAEVTADGPVGGYIRQWVIALDVLLNADRWIFIGYGLPPADYQTRWLLQIALTRRNNNKPKIQIFNPIIVSEKDDDQTRLKLPLYEFLTGYGYSADQLEARNCCITRQLTSSCNGHENKCSQI